MKTVYLIGSLTNPYIQDLAEKIRPLGFDVFDDWHSAGEIADIRFNEYRLKRKMNYREALNSWAARHIFTFDRRHLDRSHIVILVMPSGKSGHLELGYSVGSGKRTAILFDKEPEKLDQMHQFADYIALNEDELFEWLNKENVPTVTELPISSWVPLPSTRDIPQYIKVVDCTDAIHNRR